jgi:trehalose utilization protein
MSDPIRITVWNEFVHEREREDVAAVYPTGIHAVIAAGLREQLGKRAEVGTTTLGQAEHGLTQELIDSTDVLFWWGHMAHDRVEDAVVDRIHAAVLRGMGLVVLHSGHASKIFIRLMGTGCMLRWRESDERERLWVVDPSHPITAGIEAEFFELPQTEMYGEFFDIPAPDELVFISWFAGGEVFRSGCTFRRGAGRIFYFRPGHETYPIYFDVNVQRVLANAAEWAARRGTTYVGEPRNTEPLE